VEGLRRLTRIDIRSVEQVIDLDNTDDVYNWPFLYGVEVGHWSLNDEEAVQLRDFLNRGGFLMVDDFHGTYEWEVFEASMKKVFPDKPIVDLDSRDQIFHTIYDLNDRVQVPGNQHLRSGRTYEQDGYRDEWMEELLVRPMRMVDAQVTAALQNGTAFFASTSLLAIAEPMAPTPMKPTDSDIC